MSLNSGLMAGMSSIEPTRQSVLNKLSVAQPEAEVRKETTDWEPVADPVPGTTLDGRLREENTYPDHSALGVSLDSRLMEGNTRSVTQPDGGSIREFANWDAVAHPVLDINLDGRPMEGNTLYRLWGVSGEWTDGGNVASRTIGAVSAQTLSVIRPDETHTSERPALASQMKYEQPRFKSLARPMLDPDIVIIHMSTMP